MIVTYVYMFVYPLFHRVFFSAQMFFKTKLNQRGQTLVEFILLMAVIMTISLMFMKIVNSNLAIYWKFIVTKVVGDPSIRLEI